MTAFSCAMATRLRRLALLPNYDSRAPRYTSYPTAVQFTANVTAKTYGDWLAAVPADEALSIYVHIPFCARLCWFCGCNTRVVNQHQPIRDYVGFLRQEIGLVAKALGGRRRVRAIHLGGGTPNMLSPDDLDALFETLHGAFDIEADAEIAAELDPAQLSAGWTFAAAGHGLNRASLGVQDLSPDVQAAVNRCEPFEVIAAAAAMLRNAGVRSLNLDLMYGLPRQHLGDVLHTLDEVLKLRPSRVALFGYAHVPWVKPHQKLINDADLPDGAARLEQSQAAAERLVAEGYVPIGMDHFAMPDDPMAVAHAQGRLHRNFQGYTTDPPGALVGFGASAIGALAQGYVQNQPSELLWRHAIAEGRLATAKGVALTAEDRFRGEIIERLMCDMRVDLGAVAARHRRRPKDLAKIVDGLSGYEADGVLKRDGQVLAITDIGQPFVRSVCAEFDAYLDPSALRHSRIV